MPFPRLVHSQDPPKDALATRSDDDLMRLAQGGSRSAFAALVQRHALRIVGLCARFVRDAQAGQELAQDVWVMAWQRRDKYHTAGGFLPWLITVARNHCRNHLRHRNVAERYSAQLAVEVTETSPGQIEQLLIEERRRRVRRAMAELSPDMREALLLRFGEELRYDEMASVSGGGESTLRSRVHHGLKLLKKKLEKDS